MIIIKYNQKLMKHINNMFPIILLLFILIIKDIYINLLINI